MKSFLNFSIVLIIVAIFASAGESKPHQDHCECHYQSTKNGCIIARGATQTGYKCQCRISKWFVWTSCIGSKIQCNTGETCPAGCTSKECCQLAGGDCNGY